jgi:hypothetical protein
MDHLLSREECEQLRAIFHAWALNKPFAPTEPVASSLVSKGMLRAGHGAFRLTEAGVRAVKQADSGGR